MHAIICWLPVCIGVMPAPKQAQTRFHKRKPKFSSQARPNRCEPNCSEPAGEPYGLDQTGLAEKNCFLSLAKNLFCFVSINAWGKIFQHFAEKQRQRLSPQGRRGDKAHLGTQMENIFDHCWKHILKIFVQMVFKHSTQMKAYFSTFSPNNPHFFRTDILVLRKFDFEPINARKNYFFSLALRVFLYEFKGGCLREKQPCRCQIPIIWNSWTGERSIQRGGWVLSKHY